MSEPTREAFDAWCRPFVGSLFGTVAKWFDDGEDERDSAELMDALTAELHSELAGRFAVPTFGPEVVAAAERMRDRAADWFSEADYNTAVPNEFQIANDEEMIASAILAAIPPAKE